MAGSGWWLFEKGVENGEYCRLRFKRPIRKSGRLPLPLSEAFLADGVLAPCARCFPGRPCRKLPKSLNRFKVVILDGKAIKKVAKRLLALRGVAGGLLGGLALVVLDWRTGLAVAMRVHPDGDANEVPLVRGWCPTSGRWSTGPRLWLSDRAFCDLTQPARFKEKGRRLSGALSSEGQLLFVSEAACLFRARRAGPDVHGAMGLVGWLPRITAARKSGLSRCRR